MFLERKVKHSGQNNKFVYKIAPTNLNIKFWLSNYLRECLAHRDTSMHKNDLIKLYVEQISQIFSFFISLRPSEIFKIKKLFLNWTNFFKLSLNLLHKTFILKPRFPCAGVNFINVLCTAFTLPEPKSIKKTVKS